MIFDFVMDAIFWLDQKTIRDDPVLDLSVYTYMGHTATQALAEALKTNTFITTLDLWATNMSPEGAKALAEALKTNASITTLNLSYNDICPEGAKALAEALKINTSITTLDL